MTREEIMARLAGYRPELYDEDDPEIAEALRRAKADPELAAWLEDEIAFDREFACALRKVPSRGEDLESLLAKAGTGRPRSWRKRGSTGLLLAAAAVLVLGAMGIKHFYFPAPVRFPAVVSADISTFRDHMAYFASRHFVLDKTTRDLEVARTWLSEREFPVYDSTPENLAHFRGMGCKAIDWGGRRVGLVCFQRENRDIVHLFIIAREDLAGGAGPDPGRKQRFRDRETLAWQDETHIYAFVGAKPDVSLSGLL